MSQGRPADETAAAMRCARLAKLTQTALTADRHSREATKALDGARAEAVRAIVDLAPLLTTEQREQLRPILAGTIPADTNRASSTAA